MKLYSKDFQNIAGGDSRAAHGLIRAMIAAGAISVSGSERLGEKSRGRPKAIYQATDRFQEFVENLKKMAF